MQGFAGDEYILVGNELVIVDPSARRVVAATTVSASIASAPARVMTAAYKNGRATLCHGGAMELS
jgi:hypothetical protein